jgi:hypothetical protein
MTDGGQAIIYPKANSTAFGQGLTANTKVTLYSGTASRGLACDRLGNLYVIDANGGVSGLIKVVNRLNGTVYALAGSGAGALTTGAGALTVDLGVVYGVTVGSTGQVTFSAGVSGDELWQIP